MASKGEPRAEKGAYAVIDTWPMRPWRSFAAHAQVDLKNVTHSMAH